MGRQPNASEAAELAKLELPERPEVLEYLWQWWEELDMARPHGFMGLAPLTHTDIRAWAVNMDRRPAPHEVAALIRLDLAVRYPEPDGE